MRRKLFLVGSGIKSISHLTIEAQAAIKQAEKVLYLVNEPVIESWIKKYSRYSFSLENIYMSFTERREAYKKISEFIVSEVEKQQFLTVVIYGHPTVFASPGLNAIKQISNVSNEVEVQVIPGISAEDCLFADLKVDPGINGCYSIEANDLLIYDKPIITCSDFIIWQTGLIGNIGLPSALSDKTGLKLLINKLLKHYPADYEVVIYEAAMYPTVSAKIVRCNIKSLEQEKLSPISTLYIPAIKSSKRNNYVVKQLGLQEYFEKQH